VTTPAPPPGERPGPSAAGPRDMRRTYVGVLLVWVVVLITLFTFSRWFR
jgi:hypothetical protein